MSNDDRKLYVGGIPFQHNKDDLIDMFEKYGNVEDAFVIKDRETGKHRGFGFVIFENSDSLEEAINGLNKTTLEGRELIVEYAGRRKSGGGGYRRGGGGGGSYGGSSYGRGSYQRRDRDRDYGRGGYGNDRRYGGGGGGRRGYDDRY